MMLEINARPGLQYPDVQSRRSAPILEQIMDAGEIPQSAEDRVSLALRLCQENAKLQRQPPDAADALPPGNGRNVKHE